MEDEYNACTNAPRQELYGCLIDTNLQRYQDPDEFLYNMQTPPEPSVVRDGEANHRRILQRHDSQRPSSGLRVRAKH